MLTRDIWRQNYNHFSYYCHYSYLKERNFCVDLFLRVIFLTFRVDLILRIGYRWIFREDLYSRSLVEFLNLNFLWQTFFSNTSKWLYSSFNHWCLFFRQRISTVKCSEAQNREGRGGSWMWLWKNNWKLISRGTGCNEKRKRAHIRN